MGIKLLLDTHALVWALTDTSKLSPLALAAITEPTNQIFVSAASAWEIAIKHKSGKLPEAKLILKNYHAHLAKARFLELLISSENAISAAQLKWSHRDPFDRMLVAQSKTEALILVTSDALIRNSKLVNILW